MADRSGGPGAPASSAGTRMSLTEYLDAPNALHRRTASLAIVRYDVAARGDGPRIVDGAEMRDDRRAQSTRRASLTSLWRPRRAVAGETVADSTRPPGAGETVADSTSNSAAAEKGWRSWKPVRALSHLRKRRAGCLFSIEVSAARGLPAAMEGHRLAVTVRKAETKAGAVQTMPSRVRGDGAADFDETLFVRCNLYFAGGTGTGKPLRLEPRRFVVSVVAVGDTARGGACLGAHAVDVSALVLESVHRMSGSSARVRRFDTAFALDGKAGGGELLVRFGFQLMEDAGLSLYAQTEEDVASPVVGRARAHDRNSFSISRSSTPSNTRSLSPVLLAQKQQDAAISPSMRAYKQLVNRLRIEENEGGAAVVRPPPPPALALPYHPGGGDDENFSAASTTTEAVPEYEVVEKGVEAVKEVVHYQPHRDVLRELDSIAEQIEAIEALMTSNKSSSPKSATPDQHPQQQRLEADEEMLTVEFLRKLESEDMFKKKLKQLVTPTRSRPPSPRSPNPESSPPVVPDLGPSLGPAVQTRDGGFLVSMNPFDAPLSSRDGPPKLAMQVSRPFVLPGAMAATGFDVLHSMAAFGGADQVRHKLATFGRMDNLTGKFPEQVAFEGIAEAVIGARRADGDGEHATSSAAARSVHLVRRLAAAVCAGRSERVATGIWTAGGHDPETLDEVLAFSMQKLEAMSVDALAIQAELADEDAPFEVGAAAGGEASVFDSLVPYDQWSESSQGSSDSNGGRVTMVAAVQLRDPSRRYEAVGAPMVAVVQSARLLGAGGGGGGGRFKVRSLHVGGVQVRCQPAAGGAGGSATWRAERQKLTAMQWMLAHGYDRAAGRRTPTAAQDRARRQRPDVIWSLSSRVLAGMWLKTVRNPDVRIAATKSQVSGPSSPNVAAA